MIVADLKTISIPFSRGERCFEAEGVEIFFLTGGDWRGRFSGDEGAEEELLSRAKLRVY